MSLEIAPGALRWDDDDDQRIAIEEPDAEPVSTWRPADLEEVLRGNYQPPKPTIGRRDDGIGLLYPGKAHAVIAETEALKTWFALVIAATEMTAGHHVVFVDFEDDKASIVARLAALGVPGPVILKQFHYIRPEEPITTADASSAFADVLALRPSLVILDGITEAYGLHGLRIKENDDATEFNRRLVRPVTKTGAAVLQLDHPVKDRDSRGGYAMGGAHKLNGINGAQYVLEGLDKLAQGSKGRSRVWIRKDRPAGLRCHGLPGKEGLFWFGDLVCDSKPDGSVIANLYPPTGRDPRPFRPTVVMEKVSRALEEATEGRSAETLRAAAAANPATVRLATDLLVEEGYVRREAGGRGKATLHYSLRPYRAQSDAGH